MNIGLFTDTYYPELNGVAVSVYVLKNELEKAGHNVYVFTTTTPDAPEAEENVYRVHSLPCILITERRVGLFYQHKIASKIKKLDLDIIHTHTEFSLGIFGRIMAKELKLPLVHTYHTIYEDYTHYVVKNKLLAQRARAFARVFTKACCNTVEQVIVPTQKVEELLRNYHVKRRISIVPTGIDLSNFCKNKYSEEVIRQLKAELGIQLDEKIILYIGRISKEKNLEELLAYIPEYFNNRENVKFVIVGNGPEMEAVQELVGNYECRERILFLGERPYDEIVKYYELGDVFVSASTSETQGLTFIEAMAVGLPVLARKDECLEGILKDGENGYFFEEKKEFLQALDHILFSENQSQFENNAVVTAERFSTKQYAESILSVYGDVLKKEQVFIGNE